MRKSGWAVLFLGLLYVFFRQPLFAFLDARGVLARFTPAVDALNELARNDFSGSAFAPVPRDEWMERADIFLMQALGLFALVRFFFWVFAKRARLLLLGVNLALLFVVLQGAEWTLSLEPLQKKFGSVRYEALNERINRERAARTNRYGFTDREHAIPKSPGVFRIAVLGDSFVWGDGLARDDDIWSRRLESRLKKIYGERIEVLHWGKNGWSTEDELAFLKTEGIRYRPDLVITGFVVNDAMVKGKAVPRRLFVWDRVLRRHLALFPNTVRFLTMQANDFLYGLPYFRKWGYVGWQNSLYDGENWKAYEAVIREFAAFAKKENLRCLFVTLPLPGQNVRPKYESLFRVLNENGIPYLDLAPAIQARFGGRIQPNLPPELRANLVNGHPGRLVTDLYARETTRSLAGMAWIAPESGPSVSGPDPRIRESIRLPIPAASPAPK